MKKDNIQSLIFLYRWIALALISAAIGASAVQIFLYLFSFIQTFLKESQIPLLVWPAIGALITGAVIYRLEPKATVEGVPSYIEGVRIKNGLLSFSATFFKFWAALLTLSTYGSGGIVGPLSRVSAGIMSFIDNQLLKTFIKETPYIASVCGMAATIGAIFHTPIGGGLFAVEIIQRSRLNYQSIFPAILTSSFSVLLCQNFGWKPFFVINAPQDPIHYLIAIKVIVLSLVAGLYGGFYIKFYVLCTKLFQRGKGNILAKVLIGSVVASALTWLINPHLLGISSQIVPAALTSELVTLRGNLPPDINLVVILIIVILTKTIGNCITVGSGMSAGFTGPTAIVGILLGAGFSYLLGVPVGSPAFYAFLAGGF